MGEGGRGVKLIIHLHLLPRLRIRGAIPLLPLHALIAWTEKNLPFHFSKWTILSHSLYLSLPPSLSLSLSLSIYIYIYQKAVADA